MSARGARRYTARMHSAPHSAVQRFHRRPLLLGAAIMLPLLIVADLRGWLAVRRVDDLGAYHGVRTTVVRVIDGDTMEVDVPDALHDRSATRIALWGVNCPEPARSGRPAEPLADAATAHARSRVLGATVTLWLESHRPRDPLGRVLAHVELSDGTRLNEQMLAEGLARLDERWPHSMLTRYAQVEFAARRKAVGIWTKEPRGR